MLFKTKDGIGSLICGCDFNYGIFITDNEEIAERLRKNPYVEEVIEQKKEVKPVKKAKK